MLRLLALRGVPLTFRPAAVLLEGALVPDAYVLTVVLPTAALALTVTSLPVHLDYFRADRHQPDYHALGRRYMAGFTLVTVLGIFLSMLVAAPAHPTGIGPLLLVATASTYLNERFADEASRALEFRKAFGLWFLVQVLRSCWPMVPVALYLAGVSYDVAFLAVSVLATLGMAESFRRITGLVPRLAPEGVAAIRENSVFLVGSLLSAGFRQGPRLLVARLFPEQAHLFPDRAAPRRGKG
ncbi:MAG: hypothetical protein AAFX85_08995, partial [Pseudomonadota bacterium]